VKGAGTARRRVLAASFFSLKVHDLGAVDPSLEHEAFRIHQEVRRSALDLLASVVSTLLSAYRGSLDRLAIHHGWAEDFSSSEPVDVCGKPD
jgi:hypothetical protein